MALRVFLFLIVAAALVAALRYSQIRTTDLKVSGFVEADEIRVGSRVGGRVKAVHVEEGQQLRRGTLLVELEPFDLSERLAQAKALRAQAQSTLDRLQAGFRPEEIAQVKARVDQLAANLERLVNGPRQQEIESAVAELELARSEMTLAATRQRRAKSLLSTRAISQDDYDTATTELSVARSRVQVKTDALELLKEGTRIEEIDEARARLAEAEAAWKLKVNGFRQEEISEAMAAVQAALAAEQAIQKQIDELLIISPVDGVVEAVELQPGDLVSANAPVTSIMDLSRLWVRAYVPENRLSLRIGDQLPIQVDSFPGQTFHGRVTFIARQAEFTPGNVQTPEERSKQVFRVKVTLLDGLSQLRPGMSADVWLEEGPSHE